MAAVKKVKLQRRRLNKLIKLLEQDAKNKKGIKFDLAVVGRPSDYAEYSNGAAPRAVPLDCGTTACAMGLAALSGKFKEDGLSYKINEQNSYIELKWKGRVNFYVDAAVKLFGISRAQASYLFDPYSYNFNQCEGAKGERTVIRRIKNILEGKKIRALAE